MGNRTSKKQRASPESPTDSTAQPEEKHSPTSTISSVCSEEEDEVAELKSFDQQGRPSKVPLKYNSCWTLYVDETVSKPKLHSTLRCISQFLRAEIEKDAAMPLSIGKEASVFDERTHPITNNTYTDEIPSTDKIFEFLSSLFHAMQLNAENAIIMLIYMERMAENTNVQILPHTWRRIVLGALIMASKVWDDLAVWNVDFCSTLPKVTTDDLNQLERFYLMAMSFSVNVKASKYAKCYFVIREFAEKHNSVLTLSPLSEDDAKALELQTSNFSQQIRSIYGTGSDRCKEDELFDMRKTKSDYVYTKKAKNASIM